MPIAVYHKVVGSYVGPLVRVHEDDQYHREWVNSIHDADVFVDRPAAKEEMRKLMPDTPMSAYSFRAVKDKDDD